MDWHFVIAAEVGVAANAIDISLFRLFVGNILDWKKKYVFLFIIYSSLLWRGSLCDFLDDFDFDWLCNIPVGAKKTFIAARSHDRRSPKRFFFFIWFALLFLFLLLLSFSLCYWLLFLFYFYISFFSFFVAIFSCPYFFHFVFSVNLKFHYHYQRKFLVTETL